MRSNQKLVVYDMTNYPKDNDWWPGDFYVTVNRNVYVFLSDGTGWEKVSE